MFVYDCKTRSLFWKQELLQSTDSSGKINHGYFYHEILEGKKGSNLYYLISVENIIDGAVSKTVSLFDIDITKREIVSRMDNLPQSRILGGNCVLDDQDCIVYSAIFPSEEIRVGLSKVDPNTKNVSTSLCSGSYASDFLHSPSPDGTYWLRGDNSQISFLKTSHKKSGFFSFGKHKNEENEHFGFVLEIWKGFPLERTDVVTPMWLSQYELPDEGHLDGSIYKDGKTVFEGAWKEKTPAKRAHIFRVISGYLREHPTHNWDKIRSFQTGETDWLWPDEKTYYRNISSNLSNFEFSPIRTMVGWQPDSKAFWVKRNGFISCVGVDGTVSPKIRFERYGMRTGTWLPCAEMSSNMRAINNRRLEVQFENEIVIADGSPEVATTAIREIPKKSDQLRVAVIDDADLKLVEQADALAKKLSVYRIKLKSLNEVDCIAAIDELTKQLGPDMHERAYDQKLEAIFIHGRKQLDEQKFFDHVEINCPTANNSLKLLIEKISLSSSHLNACYDPYGERTGNSVAAFGYAALCLAKLDTNSSSLLQRYGALIDIDHEYLFKAEILPTMVDNCQSSSEQLELAEWNLFEMRGNNEKPSSIWNRTELTKLAQQHYTSTEYANHLSQRAIKCDEYYGGESYEFGCYLFDNIQQSIAKTATPWEVELFEALKIATLSRNIKNN